MEKWSDHKIHYKCLCKMICALIYSFLKTRNTFENISFPHGINHVSSAMSQIVQNVKNAIFRKIILMLSNTQCRHPIIIKWFNFKLHICYIWILHLDWLTTISRHSNTIIYFNIKYQSYIFTWYLRNFVNNTFCTSKLVKLCNIMYVPVRSL